MTIGLRPPWRAHTTTTARLNLFNYLMSGWVFLDAVILLSALFFMTAADLSPDGGLAAFLGLGGVVFVVDAAVGSSILVRRAFGPSAYMFLARLPTRVPYGAGIAVAAAALRVPLFAFLLVITFATRRLVDPPLAPLVVGSLEVLALASVMAALTVLLAGPLSRRLVQFVFVGWIWVVLTPDRSFAFLPPELKIARDILAAPLGPIADSLHAISSGIADESVVIPLLIQAGYVLVIAFLAGMQLERRPLDLH